MGRTYHLSRLTAPVAAGPTERVGTPATISIVRDDYRGRQSCVARVYSDGSCDVVSGARWLLGDLRKDIQGINPSAHKDVAETGEPLTVEA